MTTDKAALLIIDIQEDFTGPEARMPVARKQAEIMLTAVNGLVEAARENGLEAIYIGCEFPPGDRIANWIRKHAAIKGCPGAALDKRLKVIGSAYFPKHKGDAFSNPDLGAYMEEQGITAVIITGLFAEACVTKTVKGALNRGYEVTVIEDGIAGKNDRRKAKALHAFERMGVGIMRSDNLISSFETGDRDE